jgi:uncharacterized protein
MRMLAASDIHGNHETYHWLASLARNRDVQLLVLAGDLLGFAEGFDKIEDAQAADAGRITAILGDLPVPVYYIMGNDDWVDLQPSDQQFSSLHGKRIDLHGFNFVGYQCTLPFMGGVNERPEGVIATELSALEPLMDDRTVLVTHSPAAGILDSTQLGSAGSVSLLELIGRRKVRAHIHGHIHGSFGRSGRHFNVAAGRHRRAFIIELNSMTHEVVEE